MRARNLVLAFAASSAAIIAVVGSGCGGSESSNNPTPDAAVDVTVDHAIDTAPDVPDVQDAAMVCPVDADLTNIKIDAGPDGGACVACVQSACGSTAIKDCNADCDCKSAFIDFYNCVGMGGAITTCGIQTLSGLPNNIINEFQACAPPCATVCGVMIPTDGGRDGASDAADGGG